MTKHFNPSRSARGLVGAVRAEGNVAPMPENPTEAWAAIQRAFNEMQAKIDARDPLPDDVVRREEVDRISQSITEFQNTMDELSRQTAGAMIGGVGDGTLPTQAQREHGDAFARYFRSGAEANLGQLQVQAELTTQSDPDGGFLVPTMVETAIMQQLRDMSVMRQLANVRTVGALEWVQYVNMGGAGSGWTGEEETRPETGTPSLKEIRQALFELYAFPFTTQRMLDAGIIDISGWLADEVEESFAEREGEGFTTGNGNNKPLGLFSVPTVANASWSFGKYGFVKSGHANGFATTAPGDAFIDLWGALKQGYRNEATWLMNDLTQTTVRKFKDGQGNYIWAPPSAPGEVPTILGRPVNTDDYTPVVAANALPIAFGSFRRAYQILDMAGVRVMRDAITVKGKVGFYTTKYTTGGPTNYQAMKLMKIAA